MKNPSTPQRFWLPILYDSVSQSSVDLLFLLGILDIKVYSYKSDFFYVLL